MSLLECLSEKMPWSCLVRGLLERCFSAERLDELFERHARDQYTRNLLFSTVCDLLLEVVLRVHPSVHAAHQAREGGMNVSLAALYAKLNGVEPGVLAALVRETARDLARVWDELGLQQEPWLAGYPIRLLDGNCLAASEKRLRVHRDVSGAALPGKSLVVMDPERRLLVEVIPCEDGHAQERTLFDAVLSTVRAGELWIADRNFCTLGFLGGLRDRNVRVLVRQHGKLPFQEMTLWGVEVATDEGQRLREQAIRIAGHRYRRVRIALAQPTRDGDTVLDVITDLPETVGLLEVAALYRKRWTVETAFQHLEAHLRSEIDTLAYPRAALFGFSLALVAYNVFSLALAALDSAQPEPVSGAVSTYYVGHEIAATFLAVLTLTDSEDWRFLASLSPAEFAQWLHRGAARIHPRKYQKHSRGPKKPGSKAPYNPKQSHVSTQRLLEQRKSHTP
jgi:hypothetical protein